MTSTAPDPTTLRRNTSSVLSLVLLGLCLALPGCAPSDSEPEPAPDITADNPRAARLVGSWIGFNQSENAGFEFVSIAFANRGDYTASIYSGGQQREQTGKWRVVYNELVLDGKQRFDLEFRGIDNLVLRNPELRIEHVLVRKR